MKKKLGKEHRHNSMWIELANADLKMYITTGNRFYLDRAMSILKRLEKCGDHNDVG